MWQAYTTPAVRKCNFFAFRVWVSRVCLWAIFLFCTRWWEALSISHLSSGWFCIILSLTCKLSTSRQKHFSIHISLPATHQGSVKASSKAKHLGFFKLTLQKPLLKRIEAFRSRLHVRGYPDTLVNKVLSKVKFEERKSALQQKKRTQNRILPFVIQYHPALPNL